MNIAIAGAGVAGSYLGHLLQKHGHNVEIFESSNRENHWPVCAWGASRNILAMFSKHADLNFDDYIFHVGKILRMELPNDKKEYLDLNAAEKLFPSIIMIMFLIVLGYIVRSYQNQRKIS